MSRSTKLWLQREKKKLGNPPEGISYMATKDLLMLRGKGRIGVKGLTTEWVGAVLLVKGLMCGMEGNRVGGRGAVLGFWD